MGLHLHEPTPNTLLAGMVYAAGRAFDSAITPLRAARYRRQHCKYIYTGERGLKFELHPNEWIDRHIATYGIYERRLLHYLERLLPSGGTFVDVGANIGNHALFLARKAGQVHCFEPNPSAYVRLERNIALNDIGNIIVHRFGLANGNQVLRFEENTQGNLGASKFKETGRVELPVRKGDEALADIRNISLLKIDVEGMEETVLDGLRETIGREKPIVVFEYMASSNWNIIKDVLTGYFIAEPIFGTGSSAISQIKWNLRHAGMPELRRIDQPEPRYYEYLIAHRST